MEKIELLIFFSSPQISGIKKLEHINMTLHENKSASSAPFICANLREKIFATKKALNPNQIEGLKKFF